MLYMPIDVHDDVVVLDARADVQQLSQQLVHRRRLRAQVVAVAAQ